MKKKILTLLLILALAALCAFGLYRAYVSLSDQSHIDETFYQVVSDKLVSNVRAVFLSDLHLSEFGKDNCELVARVKALKPDLILIGGDMNNIRVSGYEPVLTLCRRLKDIAPTYYALGNHEVAQILTDAKIRDDIEATGVTLLNNVFTQVTVGDSTLIIGGLSQQPKDVEQYSKNIIGRLAEQEGFKLLLSHYPSNYEKIYPSDIDLVLSGHLHGGQIVLPHFNGLYSPEDGFFPKYAEGIFTQNDTTMIVSRGLGNSHDFPRINNNPELVIVDMSGSAGAYNTLRLLTNYDLLANEDEPIAVDTQTEDARTDGHIQELLDNLETETPAPSAE